jgi:hypothetical protein
MSWEYRAGRAAIALLQDFLGISRPRSCWARSSSPLRQIHYESTPAGLYDYGPGSWPDCMRRSSGTGVLAPARHTQAWVHILNGTDGDHNVS